MDIRRIFLPEASQIETISEQVHDMKADPWRNEIAKVAARRRHMKSRDSDIGKRDQVTEPCSYCGLSGAHLRGRNCPAYGVQCEICRKFDHFPSVCRANMSQKGANFRQSRMNKRHPQKIKRTEESYSSDESSDDGFIAQSVGHLRINAIRTSNNLKIQANENSIIEERVSQLENELKAAKLLIEDLIDRQQRYQYFSLMQNDSKVPPCTNQTGLRCQLDANEKTKELKSDQAMVEERKSVTAQPFRSLEQEFLETENQSQNQKLRIQDGNQIIGNKVWRNNRRKKKH